jgi:hypothetical protein
MDDPGCKAGRQEKSCPQGAIKPQRKIQHASHRSADIFTGLCRGISSIGW